MRPAARATHAIIACCTLLYGCGGDDPASPNPIDPPAVASVSVTPAAFTLEVGGTQQLTAQPRGADGSALTRAVSWSTSDASVATVDANGLVTAVGGGDVTITATSEGIEGAASGIVTLPPVAAVAVSPASASIEVGAAAQLTASVTDADGNALTGRTVTWASSDEAVATVDSNGLVTGAGVGTATITASSEGRSGSAEITVTLADFEPTEPTTLSGENDFETFTINEGVTVTLADDAVIRASGAVSISGSVSGDCAAARIEGGSVTVTGTIENVCSTAGSSADLNIVSGGALTLTGAKLGSSGTIRITNDTTFTDDVFDALLASGLAFPARRMSGPCTIAGVVPTENNVTRAADGSADGTTGGNGGDAGDWRLDCNGDVNIDGDATFTAPSVIDVPDGGNGGEGSDTDVQDPDKQEVRGGNGGNGGGLNVRSTGSINFNGTAAQPTTIRLSNGGAGGDATMVATAPGGSASATGGAGGTSGTMNIRAVGTINIQNAGGLEIVIGDGGAGGDASATGADGADAGTAAAQKGGSALALGGRGGNTPDAQLRANAGVNGRGNIVVRGGNGGQGGIATARAGKGGDGNETFPDGAEGGAVTATGGAGGNADSRDLTGSYVGTAGSGGDALFSGALGGHGWNGCSVTPPKPGGDGGVGGSGSGSGGAAGMNGAVAGSAGSARVAAATGTGGNGGDGDAHGDGGNAGADLINFMGPGPRVNDGQNYLRGNDGADCPNFAIDRTQLPGDFTHVVGVTSCPQTVGVITITNRSSEQTLEYAVSTSPPLGVSSTGGSLAAGQSVEITVIFDCSQSTSFTGSVQVQVQQAGTTTTESYTVQGNVGEE